MKRSRSYFLPLIAAAALATVPCATAVAKKGSGSSSNFAYLNALLGSNKTDVYMDGKAVYRNARENRAMKPKKVNSEGYSIQVNAAKIGLNYLSGTAEFIAGHDYTLIPMNDLATGAATFLFIDLPTLIVPKYASHVVFAVAVADAQPVDLLIDGQIVASGVGPKAFAGPFVMAGGKHTAEVLSNGVSVWYTKKLNLKSGKATTLVLTGTFASQDGYPVKLEDIIFK